MYTSEHFMLLLAKTKILIDTPSPAPSTWRCGLKHDFTKIDRRFLAIPGKNCFLELDHEPQTTPQTHDVGEIKTFHAIPNKTQLQNLTTQPHSCEGGSHKHEFEMEIRNFMLFLAKTIIYLDLPPTSYPCMQIPVIEMRLWWEWVLGIASIWNDICMQPLWKGSCLGILCKLLWKGACTGIAWNSQGLCANPLKWRLQANLFQKRHEMDCLWERRIWILHDQSECSKMLCTNHNQDKYFS